MTAVGAYELLHAEWLPLLLVVPVSWLLLVLRERVRGRRLRAWVGPRLRGLSAPRRTRPWLVGLACLLAVVAALGPLTGEPAYAVAWQGVDLVVCLDVSLSMLAGDLEPTRLARAQREIRALADRVEGDRLGLVLFAGDARVAVPLTADATTFAALADAADPVAARRGGTDLGGALDAALEVLAGRRGEHGTVLLVTDGEDLAGKGLLAAERCRERGVEVHAVGLGTALGSKIVVPGPGGSRSAFLRDRAGNEVVSALDAEGLAAVAARTGGTYRSAASETEPLVRVYEDHVLPLARATFASDEKSRRENRYQWPLLGAFLLLCLALAWRKGGAP